ncbi:MAG TPA: hypothetical protein VGX37_12390 [Allosphingosinicella sp.]|nr:hypothetical protein [Allosphingosinicella sp.]
MSAQQVFNPRLVIGLIIAGVAAFTAMLLLFAYGGNLGSSRDGRAHALSVAAIGFKGLARLVGEFEDTRLIRDSSALDSENLLIVTLEQATPAGDLNRLLQRRGARATLIVLPKWLTAGDPRHRGWVRAVGPMAGTSAAEALGGARIAVADGTRGAPALAAGEDILEGFQVPVPRFAQTIAGKGVVPLVRLGNHGALVARIGDPPHYVVADPDLLNNHGLRDPRAARAALDLIQRLNSNDAEGVDFDLTLNGIGAGSAHSMLRLAFEPPFLVMTLALFAAAVLAGLHGAFRFGPTRREARAIAFGKAALVENSAGLIRLAEREARLGGAYADVVRQETARTTGAPHWLQGEELDRYLNRLSRPGQPSFSELAAQLYAARDRHALMAAVRALSQWKKEIIR